MVSSFTCLDSPPLCFSSRLSPPSMSASNRKIYHSDSCWCGRLAQRKTSCLFIYWLINHGNPCSPCVWHTHWTLTVDTIKKGRAQFQVNVCSMVQGVVVNLKAWKCPGSWCSLSDVGRCDWSNWRRGGDFTPAEPPVAHLSYATHRLSYTSRILFAVLSDMSSTSIKKRFGLHSVLCLHLLCCCCFQTCNIYTGRINGGSCICSMQWKLGWMQILHDGVWIMIFPSTLTRSLALLNW